MVVAFLLYAVLGLYYVKRTLYKTGHAADASVGESQDGGCPDLRVEKRVPTLGGASGFTFGNYYLGLWWLTSSMGLVSELFLAYGILNFFVSLDLAVKFIRATKKEKDSGGLKGVFHRLKSHMGDRFGKPGCGASIGQSPSWFLYFAALLTKPKTFWGYVVGVPRDLITCVDTLFSLPALVIIDIVTFIQSRIVWWTWIGGVDGPGLHND